MIDLIFTDFQLIFPHISNKILVFILDVLIVAQATVYVLLVWGEWKIFKKFGERPSKSLIPYYSRYIMYKNTWSKKAYAFYFITSTSFKTLFKISSSLIKKDPDNNWADLLLLVAFFFGILSAVNGILYAFRVAEAFGKGRFFGFCMSMLYATFMLVIGFGKSEYVLKKEEPETEKTEECAVTQ